MTKYQIEGNDSEFRSLRAAKQHIFLAYEPKERLKLNGSCIVRIENERVVTKTPIHVTTDGYSFGKTIKLL